jgi:hypothetical protein
MAGTLTPTPYQTVLDGDGVAVSGAKVYTYEAGTTTNATTYTTSDLSVANANPIVADSAGRYVAYLSAGANLRFIIKTSADVTIDDQDNIQSVPGTSVNLDIEGTVGEAVTAGQVLYLSSAAESSPLTAGKWYLTDSDATATSTSPQSIGVAVSAIAINTAGTIRLAGEVDSAGSVVVGTTYYAGPTPGALVSSAPTFARQVGVGLTTSSLLLAATTAVASLLPNPLTQDLLFVDNTYDIGKSGATRPRDIFASRNLTVTEDIVVSGAGPHAIGGSTTDYTRLLLTGAFTSGGASTAAFGTYISGALTGHSGDSAAIAGVKLDNTIVTAGNCTTIAQIWVNEPQITVGTGSVTNSASVYIAGAATEATNNYALWVDSGAVKIDSSLVVGATAVAAGANALAVGAVALCAGDNSASFGYEASASGSNAYALGYSALASGDYSYAFGYDQTVSGDHSLGLGYRGTVSGNHSVLITLQASDAGDLSTANTLAIMGGNCGIGTLVPDGTLHAQTATAGSVTADSGADDLVVENSTHAGMTFLSPSGDYQQTIAFGDVGDPDSGRIVYNHNSNILALWTEGSERLTIDSTGDVGIGTTTPNYLSSAKALTVQGATQPRIELVGTRTGDDAIGDFTFINRVSTTNNVLGFIRSNRVGANDSGSLAFYTYNAGSAVLAMTLSPAGALSKASGSFKIDHPLPAKTDTHHLVHSFVEGPRADLIYRGSATLVDGTAEVDLDAAAGMTAGTWVLLCREDAQVYTSNETGWKHVRGSVSGSTLTIDCEESDCTDTISWMVVAERQDQHMLDTDWTDHEGRVIVEPEKPAAPDPEE